MLGVSGYWTVVPSSSNHITVFFFVSCDIQLVSQDRLSHVSVWPAKLALTKLV